jgi:hypothetical protein
MAGRTAAQVRSEIAAEREALHDDVDGLKATLRARLPVLVTGVVAIAMVAVGVFLGIRRLRKLP